MRLTYVDEGGIAKHEGFMVVSGAIIDGDRQLVAIENHLDILVQKHIPERIGQASSSMRLRFGAEAVISRIGTSGRGIDAFSFWRTCPRFQSTSMCP